MTLIKGFAKIFLVCSFFLLSGIFFKKQLAQTNSMVISLEEKHQKEFHSITEKLVFYVEDCKTKRRLPNANVKIDIDYEGGNKRTTKRTNVNGVGEGEFDEPKRSAFVQIEARYPGYKKGYLPKHKVKDFIDLPQKDRTICLEPIPDPVRFRNIDSLKNTPLANVKNIVKKENGGDVRVDTIYSDANGEFVISIEPNDKITVIAQYPPDYRDNNSKIVNADGSLLKTSPNQDRTIPLSPILGKASPCAEYVVNSSGDSREEYFIDDFAGQLEIQYDMYSLPDQLIVYCGRGKNKAILLKTGSPVSGVGNITIDSQNCNDKWITVEIISENTSEGSTWAYTISCKN